MMNGIISRWGRRQPHRAELQKSGSSGIEHAARDIDVRDGVAVEKNFSHAVIKEKGKHRNAGSEPGQQVYIRDARSGRALARILAICVCRPNVDCSLLQS